MNTPNELERLLQGLAGRTCWHAQFLMDGALWLELGDGQHLTVYVDAPWEVTKPDSTTIVSSDPQAEQSLDLVEDRVEAALLDPETFGLFLLFANGCSFYVAPSPDDGLRRGPCWQLRQGDTTIEVGPGTKWSKK